MTFRNFLAIMTIFVGACGPDPARSQQTRLAAKGKDTSSIDGQDALPAEFSLPDEISAEEAPYYLERVAREWIADAAIAPAEATDMAFDLVGEPDQWTGENGETVPTATISAPPGLRSLGSPGNEYWGAIRISFPVMGAGNDADQFIGGVTSDPVTGTWRWHGVSVRGDFDASVVSDGSSVIGWWETLSGAWQFAGTVDAPLHANRETGPRGCSPDLTSAMRDEPLGSASQLKMGAGPGDLGAQIDLLVMYEEDPDCVTTPHSTQACSVTDRVYYTTAMPLAVTIAAGIGKIQDAFARSGAGGGVRLVGLQALATDILPDDDVCAAQGHFNTASHKLGKEAAKARDAVGADIVLVLAADRIVTGSKTGCAANPQMPGTGRQDDSFVAVLKAGTGGTVVPLSTTSPIAWTLYPHELGHLFGLNHDRVEPSTAWESGGGPNYTFGHVACSGTSRLSTIMSYDDSGYCPSATTSTWYNRFADPSVNFPGTSVSMGTTAPVVHTPAAIDPTVLARDTMNAKRLRATISAVSNYRSPIMSLTGAELSPPPTHGADLWPGGGGTETFSWNGVGVGANYVLELGNAAGRVFSYSTTATSTPPVPYQSVLAGAPVIAFLWTQPAGSTGWTWREYRFNTNNRVTGCSQDPIGQYTSAVYGGNACLSGGSPVCTYNAASHQLNCDLSVAGGSSGGLGIASGTPTGAARFYDMMFAGTGMDGLPFCCLVSDAADQITQVNVLATSHADVVTLDGGPPATAWRAGMTFDVRGKQGDDFLLGSSSTSSSYYEQLRGYDDNDMITAGDGADVVVGGLGGDTLYGGDGNDTVIGKEGGDLLYGGPGSDVLCEDERQSLLRGEDSFNASGTTSLYVAPGAGGLWNSSSAGNTGTVTCGDTSQTGMWLDCTSLTLASPPGACATFMSP